MKQIAKNKMSVLAVCILFYGALFLHLLAYADATSTSFMIRDEEITTSGGISSSTSFEAIGAGLGLTAGRSSSTSFLITNGPLDFDAFSPTTQNWRWYSDISNETPLTALAAENTAPTDIRFQDKVKLRITVKETGGIGANEVKFRLQFSDSSNFSTNVGFVAEIGPCGTTSTWCYADGGGVDNALISSSTLSDAESCTGGSGNGCGTHNESGISTSTFAHNASSGKEYEFTVKHSGAANNTTYFFRLFDNGTGLAIPLNTGESYPSLVSGGANLTFIVSGVSSGTSTEGITTDVTSTATAVPFGTLSFGSQVEAAQRFLVTTNAEQGYQLFAFGDQAFLNSIGSEIRKVQATNESPAAWSSACTATSSGCYGYHAGDDSLSGASPARFSANDTFAGMETAAKEIAYSSNAVASDTIDIIYRAEVRATQPNGNYESGVTYIIVPVF